MRNELLHGPPHISCDLLQHDGGRDNFLDVDGILVEYENGRSVDVGNCEGTLGIELRSVGIVESNGLSSEQIFIISLRESSG